ncbi:MAG: hypothetical protein JKX85_08530, partial [Phycisphaeraceae bacterium]|nr:hypothetical protein [Phycisphaeraceae bacterium]
MRRRPQDDGSNLDSLLDALTNVVGILIIMLVVALLGMSEAVKRITQAQELTDQLNVDHLLDKEKELQALKELLRTLEPDWLSMEPQVPLHKVQLTKLRQQIETLTKKVTVQVSKKEFDIAKLQIQVKAKTEEQKKIGTQITTFINRLEELRALLDKTSLPKVPPAEIVRIPNPRDVDSSYRKVTFHVAKKRIIEETTKNYQKKLERNIATFDQRFKLMPETATDTGGYDFTKFKNLIDKSQYGDRTVDVKLIIYTNRIQMNFYIKGTSGDDIKSINRGGSKYQRAIVAIKHNGKQYARYKVSADSFAEYIKARVIADRVGIPAGWEVVVNNKSPNWAINVPVRLKFNRAKPKPKPVAPVRQPLRDSLVD